MSGLPKRKPLKSARPPRKPPNNAFRRMNTPRIPASVEMQQIQAFTAWWRAVQAIIEREVLDKIPHERTDAKGAKGMSKLVAEAYRLGVSGAKFMTKAELETAIAAARVGKGPKTGDHETGAALLEEGAAVVEEKTLSKEAAELLASNMKKARRKIDEFGQEDIDRAAARTGPRIVDYSKKEFKRLGIDVRKEPEVKDDLASWTHENVSLITKMTGEQLDKMDGIMAGAYGKRASSIEGSIREQLGVSERRAKLIARDQVLKLNAAITRNRQKAAGIKKYVWTTSNDERVRDSHVELEGETFSWDGEGDPEEGHPGDAVNCRCIPFPLLDNL